MELQHPRALMRTIVRGWPAVLGALGGYVYYATIGCVSGTCPITSNPWISTAYGALIGALLIPRAPRKPQSPAGGVSPEQPTEAAESGRE